MISWWIFVIQSGEITAELYWEQMKQPEKEEISVCGPLQDREMKPLKWEQVAQVAFSEELIALFLAFTWQLKLSWVDKAKITSSFIHC